MSDEKIKPRFSHLDFNKDMQAVIEKHKHILNPADMLALAAHLVGWLMALQDEQHVSEQAAMEMIAKNMQIGNIAARKHMNSKNMGAANEN